jgi:putative ABC transport system ATP-binding protein
MLQLDSIHKQYHRRGSSVEALRPTSLTIDAGDFVALIGPSGSGKTTMLSILGGMLAPTSGKLLLDGESMYDLSTAHRARLRNAKIGFVFQHFNLIPWLSALENVQLPLSLYSTDSELDQQAQAEELLDQFGLAERMSHRPSELSAGQQQRVALARALVTNPRLILADEPTGNLDPDSREVVLRALADFHAEGRTIVLVTHDHSVSSAASRSLRIADGEVRAVERDIAEAA